MSIISGMDNVITHIKQQEVIIKQLKDKDKSVTKFLKDTVFPNLKQQNDTIDELEETIKLLTEMLDDTEKVVYSYDKSCRDGDGKFGKFGDGGVGWICSVDLVYDLQRVWMDTEDKDLFPDPDDDY
tara:strand:- start:33 stop:410 length:378 start_codon:yes stop_codon:yes gene_type:complete